MSDNNEMIELDNGNVSMWIENESSIMFKAAVKGYNDPVELTIDEARVIAESLLSLAERLDNLSAYQ
jgi:hypothetical protein